MNLRLMFSLLLLGCLSARADTPDETAMTARERALARREAMLVQVEDVPGLPRVLLIGDSISMGYTLPVRRRLEGVANVHRPPENCFDSSNGLEKLDQWLGEGKWDVIHFNFGMHDNNHLDADGKLTDTQVGQLVATPTQYGENLREIVRRLKATEATLIFATTTPIPPDSRGRIAGAEVAYNRIAKTVMQQAGVEVNDLHAFIADHDIPRIAPNNVHYSDANSELLADEVVRHVRKALADRD